MNSPLWQLILARVRSYYREPGTVFWTFGFPVVVSLVLGMAFKNRPPEPVSVAIEAGAGAEAVERALAASPTVKAHRLEPAAARQALRTGKVDLVVAAGAPRTYRFDPTRPEGRMARLLTDDALQRAEGRTDPTASADDRVTEPGSRYIDSLIPGLVGLGLMSSGLWGIGFVIVEMRTRKLIKRLVATPMKKSHFLLGFVFMRAAFVIFELPVLFGFGALVFGVPMRGSPLLLGAIAILGALVFAGVGIALASRAENTQTVTGLINLVSMPMFLVSGTFFSSARFPEVIQPVVRALPLTALNDALRAVMLDGAGPLQVVRPVAVLLVWGMVSFGAALKLFRWR